MKIFKVTSLVASVALFLPISLASCTNYDTRAKNDAATGALMGAAAGAIIGGDTEDAVLGAAIGGAAGYGVGKARE
ncbi:MAG: glycine zipper family protein [Akkermansiaceae bacterium]